MRPELTHPLRFWNTLARRKEEFVPLEPPAVRLYTCGPTVYNFAHIGNLRTYVFEDLLRRYLTWRGYAVTQVMNVTDVDDKTIRGFVAEHPHLPTDRPAVSAFQAHTRRWVDAFYEDLDTLNIERAEHCPHATVYVDKPDARHNMVKIIQGLLDKGYAYRGEDGSIYYDISKFRDYGRLAHLDMEGLKPGARVSHDEYDKDHASDFALWKAWDPGDGAVFWDAEFRDRDGNLWRSRGRPGWHIECSAMSMDLLGDSFDIHAGGVDLIFPHHQNEIAQSEAFAGKTFVKYWLHSEHLIVNGKKMSKSLGNFFTLRDLVRDTKFGGKRWDPMAIRHFFISSHYRSKLNLTVEALRAAEGAVERLRQCFRLVSECAGGETGAHSDEDVDLTRRDFDAAMDDDLNSPAAFGILFTKVGRWNAAMNHGEMSSERASAIKHWLIDLDARLLGLGIPTTVSSVNEARRLAERRMVARAAKDFASADELRQEIKRLGFTVEDTRDGYRLIPLAESHR